MAFWTQRICCVLASAFVVVSADFKAGAECGIAVSDGVTSLIDASDYIYQSVIDCGKAPTLTEAGWLCSADISNVIASVAEMAMYTVNVFGFCFDQHVARPKCVRSNLKLATAVAELTAASSMIHVGCVDHHVPDPTKRKFHKAKCVVDIKKMSRYSLETLGVATSIKNACDHQRTACASKVLDGASSLSGVTEYIIAAFYDCRSQVPMNTQCGRNIAKLVKAVTKIGSVALHVRDDCANHTTYKTPPTAVSSVLDGFHSGIGKALDVDDTKHKLEDLLDSISHHLPGGARRRYDDRDEVDTNVASSTPFTQVNMILCASIPVALALGFFGGRMRRRSDTRVHRFVELDPLDVE